MNRANVFLVIVLALAGSKCVGELRGERTLWVYEQIATPPAPTETDRSRTQTNLGVTNYGDSLSIGALGVVDLHYFETMVQGTGRVFLGFTDRGKGVRASLFESRESLSLEIARHFASTENHYGRLGLGYLQFFPTSLQHWLRVSLATGIMDTAASPWSLNLHATLFASVEGNLKNLIISVASYRVIKPDLGSKLSFGGFISWSSRMREVNAGTVAIYEQMLFSLGPAFQFATHFGDFTIKVPWRLWIDKEIVLINGNYVSGNPSEFTGIPDLSFNWALKF